VQIKLALKALHTLEERRPKGGMHAFELANPVAAKRLLMLEEHRAPRGIARR
jgi:hypothetical protein